MNKLTEAHRLKVARAISGLDLRQIAPKLGISYSYMARMEAGTRKITKPVKKWMDKMIDDFYDEPQEWESPDDFCPCGNLKADESEVCEECL